MIGTVLQFAVKAEWQMRGSEHAHMLFWCQDVHPALELKEHENGTVKLGNNECLKEYAERYISAWVPEIQDTDFLTEPPENIAEIIQRDPVRDITETFKSVEQKSEMRDLILATHAQFHNCNRYCTENFTKSCKSMFPFARCNEANIDEMSDKMGTPHFRIRIRLNHSK